MGRHTLIEIGHIALGVAAAVVITWLSAWAVLSQARTIWMVGWVATVVTALMGIHPLRLALRRDREERAR